MTSVKESVELDIGLRGPGASDLGILQQQRGKATVATLMTVPR